MDIVTYKLSQKYADKVAAGFSSVRVDGLNIIFTLNDGKTTTVTVPAPKDGEKGDTGISITNVTLDSQSHLICTLSDGSTVDAGLVHQGVDGKDGQNGKDGINGKDGQNGKDGIDGAKGADGKDGKNYSVEVVESTTTTLEIEPNKFYKFGEETELNITLAEITDETQLNEYMFEFISGATATTLTLPDTIKWLGIPTIEANKIYQCSIVDNIGVLLGVSNV